MSHHSIYKIIQFLSIDVLAGSVAVMIFSVRLLNVSPTPIWWIILPAAVWSFYTIDHLIDGYKSKGTTSIKRHGFHYRNRFILVTLSAIAAVISLTLSVLYLDNRIILTGLIIGLIVVVYFLLVYLKKQQSVFLQKELIIALVYVGGIWLAPLIWNGQFPDMSIISILLVFFVLAWAEGIMASYFDFEYDLKEGHSSFTVFFGPKNGRKFLILLHVAVFLIMLFGIGYSKSNLQLASLIILTIMNLCLLCIILFPHFFQQKERYRILGESIFLFPALIVLF